MSRLNELPPDQRAVLQLLLQRGQAYEDISDLLGLDVDAVRDRAHAALEGLGPEGGGRLSAERRGEIADYLLGQQPVSRREATRDRLAASASARAWARVVADELRPLGGDALPDIPAEGFEADADTEGDPGRGRDREPAWSARGADAPSSRLGGALLLGGLAILLAVGVIFLVNGGGGEDDGDRAATTETTPTQTGPTGPTGTTGTTGQPEVIAQVELRPVERGSRAVGLVQILVQGEQRALAVAGQGLRPNRRDAYAMWLFNSRSRSRLLGYVDPPVGRDGRFQSVNRIPRDLTSFREIVLSRETRQTGRPTTLVLRGSLRQLRRR